MSANDNMSKPQFRRIINALCQRWHIPAYANYVSESYWPAFSRLEEEGQQAFLGVLGTREKHMEGCVLVTVEGGLISEVVYYPEKDDALRMAEGIWPEMDPETDDLKVFDLEENVVWQPPREG